MLVGVVLIVDAAGVDLEEDRDACPARPGRLGITRSELALILLFALEPNQLACREQL